MQQVGNKYSVYITVCKTYHIKFIILPITLSLPVREELRLRAFK